MCIRDRNTLVDMISGMEVKEDDEDFMNAVDYMFAGLEKRKPDCFAVKQYKKYKLASGKTAKSILISCGARLAPFDIPQLREIMSYDELELDRMGDRRTATFFCISAVSYTHLDVYKRQDHRSYKRQGIDKIPSVHLGPAASQMENRGIRTDKGEVNLSLIHI